MLSHAMLASISEGCQMGFFSKSTDKDQDKDKWKDKYLDLLDNQELTEKTHKANQELLCKAIVRLSIAASNIDPQLDPYLQRIRNHIKKDDVAYTELKIELENFSNAVNRLDSGAGKEDTQTSCKDSSLLFDFLLRHYDSEKQQQALGELKKSYQPVDEPQKLFSAISEIIETEEQNKPTTEQPLQQQIDPDFVAAQLTRLLERIEVPEALAQKALELKRQLGHLGSTESIVTLFDSMTSLLIEINTKNQPKQLDIDKFLLHITEQLTELGSAITDSGMAWMDASLSRNKLDQSVSEQMTALQNRSSNATQLEPLKQAITSHIAQITKEIQEHKQKEAVQREQQQGQLEELSRKIKSLESETGELQSKLVAANANAQRDTLTELPNRLAYEERIKMEIVRWQRYHTPLCLVIWDIDFFKAVNDQHGHQAGDKVLVHVANIFAKNIRRADFIARIGGEEFSLLLPHTHKHSAVKVTEKLRAMVEQERVNVGNIMVNVTVSCGITEFTKGDTHESAFERADQALYRAKEQGRNRCCIA